MAKCKLQELLI